MAVLTIYLVSTITFFLMNLVPGGPFLAEKAVSPQAQAAMEEKYGLDKPLSVQYKNYMLGLVKGDLGLSVKQRGRTVAQIIATKFPVSARLGGLSILTAVCVGIPLGSIAAFNRGKWADNVVIFIATCGIAVPSFVICTLLLMLFGLKLGWLPTVGLNSVLHYIMPVTALAFYPTAYIARLMRSSMLDVLGQDYIRTARAKGVPGFKVIFGHALKNSLIPVITYVGPMTAYILTGSMVVETVFTVGGLGTKFVSSINNQDYPMIMAVTIFLAVLMVVATLLSDLIYKAVDPRIKLD